MKADEERLSRVKQGMDEAGFDALICRLPENVVMLSGYWPLVSFTYLIVPKEGESACIIPRCDVEDAKPDLWDMEVFDYPYGVLGAGDPFDEVSRIVEKFIAGKPWKKVGFEGSFDSIAAGYGTAEPLVPAASTYSLLNSVFGQDHLKDATDFLYSQRAIKTTAEIEGMRRANEISALGLKAFIEGVDVGKTGLELAAAVEYAIVTQGTGYKGAKLIRAFPQVSTGKQETSHAYRPMVMPSTRKMEPGDLAVLELGVAADGFWSDRTRVRAAGEPTSKQMEVHRLVLSAQEAAIKTVHAGIRTGEVDRAAREIISEAGYGKDFNHITGHGIGFRYHEPIPMIRPDGDTILRPGMVFSVEPGVYFPAMGGIRIEDNILVTETGPEVLGPISKEL